MKKRLLILFIFFFWVAGCDEKQVTQTSQDDIVPAERIPVDYTILVDNSASIKGYERKLVRDAIKLFINLLDDNDHVSIISFGEGARIIGSGITTAKNKVKLNQDIDQNINFKHQFSDIRAGLKILSESKKTLFRQSGNMRMAIIFSDGYLETPSKKDGKAYDQIVELKDQSLQDIMFYCLGLGRKTLKRPIKNTDNITGRILLQDVIAGSTGRFRPIMDIAELAGSFVEIIKQTKDLPEVFEKNTSIFNLDSTVNDIVIIIPKRDRNGKRLYDDAMLEIITPQQKGISRVNKRGLKNITWEIGYESVDVIKIDAPQVGVWKVGLKKGNLPRFQMLIRTDLELKATLLHHYFENQEIAFTPYIYDRVSRSIKDDGYKFSAKINSNTYPGVKEPGQRDKIYISNLKAGKYEVKFKAELPSDKFFSRVSQIYEVNILAGVFKFSNSEPEPYNIIPFFSKPLLFTVDLNTDKFQISDAQLLHFVRENGKTSSFGYKTEMPKDTKKAATAFTPDLKGDYRSQIKLVLKDDNGIRQTVLLPHIQYQVIDYRIHFWCTIGALGLFVLLIARFLFCTFTFEVTVRQGSNKKILTIPKTGSYQFSTVDLLDNKEINILLFSRKMPLRCSIMPWAKITASAKVIVDGDELYPGVKIGPGSLIKINLSPDPLKISFE